MKKEELPGVKLFGESAMITLGREMQAKENFKDAEKIYLLCLEEFPKSGEAYWRLGDLYILMEETKKAIEIYQKGYSIEPNNKFLIQRIENAQN